MSPVKTHISPSSAPKPPAVPPPKAPIRLPAPLFSHLSLELHVGHVREVLNLLSEISFLAGILFPHFGQSAVNGHTYDYTDNDTLAAHKDKFCASQILGKRNS